jgi:chemotaxis methyl-accepting protein methylase
MYNLRRIRTRAMTDLHNHEVSESLLLFTPNRGRASQILITASRAGEESESSSASCLESTPQAGQAPITAPDSDQDALMRRETQTNGE